MSHRSLVFMWALFLGFSSTVPAEANPASVQIINPENQPIPVYQAERLPFQFRFSARTGSLDFCDPIEIPAGMMLTVETVWVDVYSDAEHPEPFRLRVRQGDTTDFFSPPMSLVDNRRGWTGHALFHPRIFVGAMDSGVDVTLSACVPEDRHVTGSVSFRGMVSGYLEPVEIVDGNRLDETRPEPQLSTRPTAPELLMAW